MLVSWPAFRTHREADAGRQWIYEKLLISHDARMTLMG
jgi:hypothetical protein